MTQADSVHSTPPTNTSVDSHTSGAENAQDSLFLPTDTTPEQLFRAIGKLRKDARDEINRLIMFLDETDDYVSRELEDEVDAGPCDDRELEPSLCGVTADGLKLKGEMSGDDLEGDDTPGDRRRTNRRLEVCVHLWRLQQSGRMGKGHRRDLEEDPAETGIGDRDGLNEQIGQRDWFNSGAAA